MGLEMYAYTINYAPEDSVDFKTDGAIEIHYWWQHPNLHGWMKNLYDDKGGDDPDFNYVNVELTSDDLDDLERAIQSRSLPQTRGLFFGESNGDESEDDLEFVAKARKAIADGLTVFYSSWW